MTLTVLFCVDPLHPRRVDPHFSREAGAVRDHYGELALIDHEALRAGDAEAAVRAVPRDLGPAWYRGWMLSGAEYTALAGALKRRGVQLLTHPDDYRRAHELPGWHDTFAGLTPNSVWRPLPPGGDPGAPGDLAELVRPLRAGPGIVKDYVKSRKHEWDAACYVPDVKDAAGLRAVLTAMIALQEEHLAGGVVVREFEPFDDGGEARVWWVDGEPALVGPHPDEPGGEPLPELAAVAPAVRALGCRFITTDLARRPDGAWRVVEVGDGQVSELPASADPMDLYAHLPVPD
ncbi:ATP-grasp domain-containing protein [Actinomadura parmotrematis]|uniref:ATP-grasp domain-containing protein n=1 Tax=Actinomadura parmotrematis TaxID=2864039 RepID=A0ABS7FT93_9ACTN|nr:ATP-grasp domain-containing protein [Actinomadura parmotrematis]MBW8483592.1 ATP-grasp domain-containing protein [Actinomadura parmotrematis]